MTASTQKKPISLFSVVIPARNEEESVLSTVDRIHDIFNEHGIRHEIIVVDDGSTDRTLELLEEKVHTMPELRPLSNPGQHGFGRAVAYGLDQIRGEAVVIMMADGSDDCSDAVLYWHKLSAGYDCVFGSRFTKAGGTIGYPPIKLLLNRAANTLIRFFFNIPLNDTTNAFKAYRADVINACKPFRSSQFELTVELPIEAILRGFSWTVVPITWRSRQNGKAKFRIHKMGWRYAATCMRLWIDKITGRALNPKK